MYASATLLPHRYPCTVGWVDFANGVPCLVLQSETDNAWQNWFAGGNHREGTIDEEFGMIWVPWCNQNNQKCRHARQHRNIPTEETCRFETPYYDREH